MDLVVNGYAILAAVAIAILTVAISAIIPAFRAVNVSAIEAIRMSKDVKLPRGRLAGRRKYRLTMKLFGTPGMLARRYFSRSRKKYRVTIFSLTMSVVLFIVTTTYCDYLRQFVVTNASSTNYDLTYYGSTAGEAKRLRELLIRSKGVKKAAYLNAGWDGWYELVYDEEDESDSFRDFLKKYDEMYDFDAGRHYNVYVSVVFIDDAGYEEYLKELGITSPEYMDFENAPGILVNNIEETFYIEDDNTGEYTRYTMGCQVLSEDVKELTVAESGYYYYLQQREEEDNGKTEEEPGVDFDAGTEKAQAVSSETEVYEPQMLGTYPVGAFVQSEPQICSSSYYTGRVMLVFPYSSIYNDAEPDSSVTFLMQHIDGQHDEMVESVKKTLSDAGERTSDRNFYDSYGYVKQNENIMLVINVFCYGFITLMALICVANVFNTISTNIGLRRRDFAMIRSVGLSYSGVKRMMIFECLLYGIRSLAFALPISVAFSYLLYKIYGGAGEFAFYIPWLSVLIAVVGVFVMVGISMVYAVNKINSDNLIDELKNDN